MTQKAIARLFGVEVPAISKHLGNIYETGELEQKATISILETVRLEGARSVKQKLEYYSLDAIIAAGYRVNSYQATQFRICATKTLKEFVIKGFVLDNERFKQGQRFGIEGRTGIRNIQKTTGPGVYFGLRPSNQTGSGETKGRQWIKRPKPPSNGPHSNGLPCSAGGSPPS